MSNALTKRIQKLESILRTRAVPQVVFRYGSLQLLPNDTPGERHVVVSKSEPTALPNVARCEFEERSGPAPVGPELVFDVYLSWEFDVDSFNH
jgi:hypothetical protein